MIGHRQVGYFALAPFSSTPVPLVWKLFAREYSLPSLSCYGFETHFLPALLASRETVVIQVFLFPFNSSILFAQATFSLQALEKSYLRVLQLDEFPWLRSPTLYLNTMPTMVSHLCGYKTWQGPGNQSTHAVSNYAVFSRSHSLRQPRISYETLNQNRNQHVRIHYRNRDNMQIQ